jgi:hypothetical protein
MHSESNQPLNRLESAMEEPRGGDQGEQKRFLSVADAFEDAKQLASAIPIAEPVLAFLFAKTRCCAMSLAHWEQQVRLATAFDVNMTRFGSTALIKDIEKQIDRTVKAGVIRELTAAPTLAIGFHGGYSVPRRKLFARLLPQGVVLGASGKYAAHDGAFALFAAREALLENRPVLMAPDGRFGKESGTIAVLGAHLPVTDGAPFLAHATGCKVKWFALTWSGIGFTLQTIPGPQRQDGERFSDYRRRFYDFYAERLEEAFTGDPMNLPLIQNWRLTFGAMLAGKVYKSRRPTR